MYLDSQSLCWKRVSQIQKDTFQDENEEIEFFRKESTFILSIKEVAPKALSIRNSKESMSLQKRK